jgi:hypothetical protein
MTDIEKMELLGVKLLLKDIEIKLNKLLEDRVPDVPLQTKDKSGNTIPDTPIRNQAGPKSIYEQMNVPTPSQREIREHTMNTGEIANR